MTENEAINGLETLKYQCKYNGECGTCNICCSAVPLAIQALEEIQQYRAIETELRERYHANVDIKMIMQHFIETIFKGEKHEGFCILTNEDAKMWEQYRAIGTVEEIQQKDEVIATQRDIIDGVYKDYEKYLKIGTIEEFKALKEKSEPMPWIQEDMGEGETLWKCPDCNEYWALMEGTPKDNQYNFCPKCGRALKLSE